MSNEEQYYFIFKFVDGSTQEFEQNDDTLSAKIRNTEKNKIIVDNVIINLDNVLKVTIETKSQREEIKRLSDEKARENAEIIRSMRF